MSNALPRKWRGKSFPNGEFSFAKEKRFDVHGTNRLQGTKDQEWALSLVRLHGVLKAIRAITEYGESHREMSLETQGVEAALDLSMVSISAKKPKGLNGITRKGRRIVRNGAYLLETNFNKNRLSFATFTLPPLTDEGFSEVSDNWGRVVEGVCKSIRRRLVEVGLPSHIIGCTEVQEKRFRKHNGIPLHLHILFVGRHSKKAWAISPSDMRKAWRDAVNNVLSCPLGNGEFRASENVQRVRKSASGYLGKYMSKGVEAIELLTSQYPNIRLPHQWHTCTRALRKWIERETKVIDTHKLELLVYACVHSIKEVCIWSGLKYLKDKMGREFLIAGNGTLTNSAKKWVRGLTESPCTA